MTAQQDANPITAALGERSNPEASRARSLLRQLAIAATSIVLLASAGAEYQSMATRVDEKRLPPPGRLVDVGGFRMHVLCTGPEAAGPTLILEHGGGGFGASDWSIAQPELARFARVCSYDRAGYGWSEPSSAPRTVEPETDELERLLDAAKIAPPYVMVDDSLGAYTSRLFATRHPERVVGMVFVDVSTEGEWVQSDIRRFNANFGVFARGARAVAPFGLWRALGEFGVVTHPLVPYLPASLGARLQPLTYGPAYWSTVAEETSIQSLETSARVLERTRRSFGSMPLIVLAAGGGYPNEATRRFWLAEQAGQARLSDRGELRVFEDATHVTLATERVDAIVQAVHDVLDRAGG